MEHSTGRFMSLWYLDQVCISTRLAMNEATGCVRGTAISVQIVRLSPATRSIRLPVVPSKQC
jgi:hypothetical protein